MKIALLGLPNAGKTTIFNTLTRSEAEVTSYSNARAEPNLAVVEVGDERVTRLAEMYHPKKTTYATIDLMDFSGFTEGSAREGLFPPELMQLVRNSHALAVVLRNFEDDLNGTPLPVRDFQQIHEELLLSDLMIAETRHERIRHGYKRGIKSNELEREEKVMEQIVDRLNENAPIRELELSPDDDKTIRGYQFLTRKPLLVILNSEESGFGRNEGVIAELEQSGRVMEFAGHFEMELSRMEDDEAALFMEDMGIRESARDRLTQFAYEILGYISFFTVGPDEVRAWNITSGDTALDAAGSIHSDLARGFIRAECFTYDDLMECRSEKAVKEKGRFRLEGKNYVVRDGDVLNIRFNV
jgi:GTP-binding protein YchF